MSAVQVLEYLDAQGRSPYKDWFDNLGPVAAAKIAAAVYRLEAGISALAIASTSARTERAS